MQIEFPMRNDDRMSRKTIPLTLHNLRILSSCQNQELIELLVDRFVHRTMEPLMDSDREREREGIRRWNAVDVLPRFSNRDKSQVQID